MVKDEYEEFYKKRVGIITRKDEYHKLEGILNYETDTQLFLNEISYDCPWFDFTNRQGIVSKDKIVLVYLAEKPKQE